MAGGVPPGISRHRTTRGFQYRDARGRPCRSPAVIKRINALAIPPAWEQVWINPDAGGRVQAWGRDARGRKQYRYHARWRARREGTKFGQLVAFGLALPKLRRRLRRDLRQRGLPRGKVVAAIVSLLDRTYLRIGNAEYAKANGSFGLTTLLDRHVRISRAVVAFAFPGKSKVWQERLHRDPTLAAVVKQCRDLPGSHLFQALDSSRNPCRINARDVNRYLRETTGADFTAKTFRTWAGTVLAMSRLARGHTNDVDIHPKRVLVEVIKDVAAELGNTAAVCRASYIHPLLLKTFLAGKLVVRRQPSGPGLSMDEAITLVFLKRSSSPRH